MVGRLLEDSKKKKKKRTCKGDTGMGYCSFPGLGCDTVGGVATGAAWRVHGRRACVHNRAAARAAAHATARARAQDMGAVCAISFPWNQVATSIFASRHGWAGTGWFWVVT